MAKIKRETAMDFLGGLGLDEASSPQNLSVTNLIPDPQQPRKKFDEEAMERLVSGIQSDGILQPLLVRESGTAYIITDGERRWRAAQELGIDMVPCYIRNDIDVNRIRFVQAMANSNRENLSDYELAVIIQEHLDANPQIKQKDVAKQIGVSASSVTRLLAMLEPKFVDLAKEGLIESASALSHFKKLDTDAQTKLLDDVYTKRQAITREAVEAIRSDSAPRKREQTKRTEETKENQKIEQAHENTDTSSISSGRSSINSNVKLSLSVDDIDLLISHFADRSVKLDIKVSNEIASKLIESLGQPIPSERTDFQKAIQDGIEKSRGSIPTG